MAKPLRDIASKAPKEGKLSGVKKSTTEPEDISDFNASSGNQDFAKKHKVEKHSDRVGNDDGVYKAKVKQTDMSKHGYKKPQDAKIYEAKCNMTEAGTMCEVHGDKACSSDKVPEAGAGKRGMIVDKKKLNEVLSKKSLTQIDEISKEKLGDYTKSAVRDLASRQYALGKSNGTGEIPDTRKLMNRRKGIDKAVSKLTNEDAMPVLEAEKKKKTQKESAPGDTPIRMPSGNVGDSDTGRI
jgi:hypothetical protein